jgi:hypothetical protein
MLLGLLLACVLGQSAGATRLDKRRHGASDSAGAMGERGLASGNGNTDEWLQASDGVGNWNLQERRKQEEERRKKKEE